MHGVPLCPVTPVGLVIVRLSLYTHASADPPIPSRVGAHASHETTIQVALTVIVYLKRGVVCTRDGKDEYRDPPHPVEYCALEPGYIEDATRDEWLKVRRRG